MNNQSFSIPLTLSPDDNLRLANLCGQFDENIQLIENQLSVQIHHRGHQFSLTGKEEAVHAAASVLKLLYKQTEADKDIDLHDVHIALRSEKNRSPELVEEDEKADQRKEIILHTKMGALKGRTKNQIEYLHRIFENTVNFGIGPAGTGKTFLAVACAIDALEKELVKRIVLVRPAVEAGERLGFLPGDLSEKVNPYLRPIYDALYAMLGFERVAKLIEKNIIEIAPLAYMRGRTLSDAYIILDEGQNTTIEQMKMFLTRIGFGARAVITGDITQIDLLQDQRSGLRHVIHLLRDVKDISFTFFDSSDVLRHPVVQRIIRAYEKEEK